MIDDPDAYYGRGPGFAGRDIAYCAADALDDQRLIRMLHNEGRVGFPAPCNSHSPDSDFYRLEEVRCCLEQSHSTLTVS